MLNINERAFLVSADANDTAVHSFVRQHDGAPVEDFRQAFRERFGYMPFHDSEQQTDEEVIRRCLQTGDVLVRVISGTMRVEESANSTT